ncbi:MAG: metal-dependent transcriptional regulator [Candidatus Geothermincolia bacterium]
MPSEKVEEYLEGIFKLQCEEGQANVSRLAERLGVKPASASEMLKRLEKEKLIAHGPKRGIGLTQRGERMARTLVRRHRLSERFLTDVLGMSWDVAHAEACKFEHVISPDVEKKLAEMMGNPTTCPHGFPIPDDKGKMETPSLKRLSDFCAREKGHIAKVDEEQPALLQYLSSLGLVPNVSLQVMEIAPFNGPLLVRVGKAKYALGQEVAGKIWMKE